MSRYYKIISGSLTLFTLLSFPLAGQCDIQRDSQTWLNLQFMGNFDKESNAFKRFKYWLESQERIGDDISRSTQTLFRTGLGYDLTKKWSLWVGYAWIHTGIPLTTQPFIENRIWQQLLWLNKTKRFTFMSRTRLEQRFSKVFDKIAYRAREQVKVSIPFKYHPKISFVSHEEVFWYLNRYAGRNQGFDQSRFFIGMGYKLTSKATAEIGYMNQYIRRAGSPDFQANILSINCYVNFS